MGKYYEAYEERYQAVEKAGIPLWGHSEENGAMLKILAEWVEKTILPEKESWILPAARPQPASFFPGSAANT